VTDKSPKILLDPPNIYVCISNICACISNIYACIISVFQNLYACVVGDWKWGVFPACSWLVLAAGVGGYVLTGVEIVGLSCIFLHFCSC